MSYIILIIVSAIVIAIGLALYQRSKMIEYCNIIKEVVNFEIGERTKLYIIKSILNIEYILKKDESKLNSFPDLKRMYLNELDYYKRLSSLESKKLSESEATKLILILQTKLTSSSIMRF
jgi:hypothetical protein